MKRGQVTVSGTVKRSGLAGGFWSLESDAGTTYQLDGGGRDLLRDGQRARVTGQILSDAAGIGMAGDILRVQSYEIG